ncbi:MAG: glycoside hydrolase family 2 TIM barrel-domain containing protein [Prevotellaceae bacterium]|nr:glycoside hydrolase family 2 TIM barrel-domain containing protein [Prevotellaceae bacterium]
MKIRLACIFFLAQIASTFAQQRIDRIINDGWSVYHASDVNKNPQRQDVTIPHTWNATDVFDGPDYRRTSFIYERTIKWEKPMEGKRVFLKFDAVNSFAEIAINQHFVGQHKGGYTAFCFEITDYLEHDTTNLLTVVASNAYRRDVAPLAGDFNIYGGITRPVHLIITNCDCISPIDFASSGVYVHPVEVDAKHAEVDVETVLSLTEQDGNAQVRTSLIDASGNVVAKATAKADGNKVTTRLSIDKPHLWDGRRAPYLYTVRAELMHGETVVDAVEETTGLRSFAVDAENGFYLNGNSLDLHGVCRHEETYNKGGVYSEEAMRIDSRLIYDLGCTGVRFVHYPHSRYDVQQYDSLGIVVWYELNLAGPGGYNLPGYVKNPELEASIMQNLEEMIKQNYNSPSICFWSLCNELSFKYDEPATFLKQLHAKAKQLDPSRLTTMAICYDQDKFQHITDIIGWNKYFGWYDDAKGGIGEFMDGAHELAGSQPIGVCEYGAAASVKQHSFEKRQSTHVHFEEYQARVHEDNWMQMVGRKYLWCKFIWQWADNPSSIRDEGDTKGMNDKGLVTYDRKTLKDSYLFYQANWSDKPILSIASKRFTERTDASTDIKVYTNQKDATLYVNGKRIGKAKADSLHRIVYNNVLLREGVNTIKVVSDKLSDECKWTLQPTANR